MNLSLHSRLAFGVEIVILLQNNQRQHRTLHAHKDVLLYTLC
jgi:hypothetical protein